MSGTKVVGYDGSETARAALDYDAPSSFLAKPYFQMAVRNGQARGQELLEEHSVYRAGSRSSPC